MTDLIYTVIIILQMISQDFLLTMIEQFNILAKRITDLMNYIIATLKGVIQVKLLELPIFKKIPLINDAQSTKEDRSAFGAIVRKEFTDYIQSWRIIILLIIIALTCLFSFYIAISNILDVLYFSYQVFKDIVKYVYLTLFLQFRIFYQILMWQ